jgi:ABC-2 type transport system permease protein
MLRPVSVLGLRFVRELGESFARLVFVVPVGVALSIAYTGSIPHRGALMLAFPAILLAVACNVASVHAFASLSFWVRDARAAWFLFQKLIFLPGGMLLPLQLLPHVIAIAAWVMPFWTMAYAPGRLASGFAEPLLYVGQIFWCVVLFGIASGLFLLGQRRIQRGLV